MARSTKHSLTIVFRFFPGTKGQAQLLEAELENGAKFIVDPRGLSGNLGRNLALFCQAAALEEHADGRPSPREAKAAYDESLVRVVAPGTAQGVSPLKDKQKKKAEQRALQDELDALEIEI